MDERIGRIHSLKSDEYLLIQYIVHRLYRSLVAIGDFEAASQLNRTKSKKRVGKARKGAEKKKAKGKKRKFADENEYSADDEDLQYVPTKRRRADSS